MLRVKNLSVAYGKIQVVRGVGFSVKPGQIVGIVGESGSGKSTMLKSLAGLLEKYGQVTEGEAFYEGEDLLKLSEKQFRKLRGKEIALVFQHPELSLDPLWKIGKTYYESVRVHRTLSRAESDSEAERLFEALHLENPRRILESYPFELSGGMCQRAAIAIAIANGPRLLFADEPTSALDVTIQKQVIDTMLELRKQFGTSIVIVSHNMGVIAAMADLVGVMKQGELVEWGTKEQVLYHPKHPYTRELICAIPKIREITPNIKRGMASDSAGEEGSHGV
ncbi:MAG: ABC transporter ATP-binding protein [Lachnospiraceae bacterium]|nr:ABC transporter ATP-binding protein [Lachnospiraceae bacterium]